MYLLNFNDYNIINLSKLLSVNVKYIQFNGNTFTLYVIYIIITYLSNVGINYYKYMGNNISA